MIPIECGSRLTGSSYLKVQVLGYFFTKDTVAAEPNRALFLLNSHARVNKLQCYLGYLPSFCEDYFSSSVKG